ncbi:MAG: cation-translocating P-type ATPase [Selenomonadaceae bacterium]|nr:cation-translocating P-type ATPase [Selenomonadaceae bacterium]
MNKLSTKQIIAVDFALAAIISIYWLTTGITAEHGLFIFFAILIAGSPFSYMLARTLPYWRAANVIEGEDISVQSAKIMRELSYLDTLLFAKNGTLTVGNPYISDIVPEGITKSSLLALAASIEKDAKHIVGRALYNAAISRGLRLQHSSATNEIDGKGMEGMVGGTAIRVGKMNWLKEEGVEISAELLTKHDQLAFHGKNPIFVANGKRARGIIALLDEIPPGFMTAIRRIKKLGINTTVITTDSQRTANAVKKELSLDEAKGGLSREEKLREIKLLKVAGKTVGMIGDLYRDQSILETADIGIELIPKKVEPFNIHKVEVAGIEEDNKESTKIDSLFPPFIPNLILKGGLASLIPAVEIARRAKEITRQNLILSYLSWLLLLPYAMGFFVAFGGDFLNVDSAAVGVGVTMLLIFFNSLRVH